MGDSANKAVGTSNNAPLAGVKVLDFGWALVGSLTSKLLADHGAQVVKVESALRPCLSRLDKQVAVSRRDSLDDKPWFSHFNTSKLSLQLNMKHERVREVLEPLIEWADVIVENFSPGTMKKMGLDYHSIRERRPDIVMVSGSVFGQTGPYAENWGVDGTGAALSSRMFMTGWPDRNPVTPSVPYGDVVLPYFMAATVAAALAHKHQTGQGEYIDASMYEVCVQQMSAAITASQKQQPLKRKGNRSEQVLFQGVFPCAVAATSITPPSTTITPTTAQSSTSATTSPTTTETSLEDAWIALSIFSVNEWQQLLNHLPKGNWPTADALTQLNESELDKLDQQLGAWTATQERYALMHRLQADGIAAGVVQDIRDTFQRDPQLAHRDYLKNLEHPYLGQFGHQTPPIKLSRTPAHVKLAPSMGQHNEMICQDLLGMSTDAFASLKAAGVFV